MERAWESGEVREVFAGPHRMRLESPDLVFLTFVGDVAAAEAFVMLGEWQSFAEKQAWTLTLVDLSRAGSIAPEARKMSMSLPLKGRGTAAFGAGFAQRVLATLLARAYALLRPEADSPMAFFATEAEARAWLDERRRSLESERRRGSQSAG